MLLTTPPGFRPIHLEYAVAKGCHVFMEKSFAVDAPGIRRVLRAGEEAKKKNLKIAGGLMSRHSMSLAGAIEQIHGGAIGEVITVWAYREHAPVGFTPKSPGESELAHQIRNYSNFTWLNGSFLLDWLIHNIDVSCWVKDAWPVSAQGHGGRQVRTEPDQLFDHYSVEYTLRRRHADAGPRPAHRRLLGLLGACGSRRQGLGRPRRRDSPSPHLQGPPQTPENLLWDYKGPPCNSYQVRARFAVRGHSPGQALQRGGALRQGGDDRHPRPHGRRIGQARDLGRGDGLESRTGAGPGSVSRCRPMRR